MSRVGRLRSRPVPLTLAVLLLAAAPAAAQDPAPTEAKAPTEATAPPTVDVTGFVDVYYGYNFNKVDPALRAFDVQHNALSLNVAEIVFAKGVTKGSRVGFRTDLDFGKTADLVASFEPEKDAGREIYKFVQQAYLTVLAGDKVTLDFGKFVTIHGAEVIESPDNWNYTRSLLFNLAIPFYHVGARATLPVNDKLTLAGLVVNGWNNSSEIYGGVPCLALQATLKPSAKVTWIANYMVGQEAPDPADTRSLFDTTLSLNLSPKLSLMGNFDYGKEGDLKWWGAAAYAKLHPSANWALVGRYEYVDDSEGGFMTIGDKAQSVTVTSDHKVAGDLKVRFEYRTDFVDSPFFAKLDTATKTRSQTSLTVGLVYAFGGKI